MQQAAASDTVVPEAHDTRGTATAVANRPLECAVGYRRSSHAEALGHRGCGEHIEGRLVLPIGVGQHHERKR
jgi:hypothetical protein